MKTLSLAALLTFFSAVAYAQMPPPPDGGDGRPHGPPPEIVAACEGQAMGTEVSVTFRNGDVHTVKCGMPPPPRNGPPDGNAPSDGGPPPQ